MDLVVGASSRKKKRYLCSYSQMVVEGKDPGEIASLEHSGKAGPSGSYLWQVRALIRAGNNTETERGQQPESRPDPSLDLGHENLIGMMFKKILSEVHGVKKWEI